MHGNTYGRMPCLLVLSFLTANLALSSKRIRKFSPVAIIGTVQQSDHLPRKFAVARIYLGVDARFGRS